MGLDLFSMQMETFLQVNLNIGSYQDMVVTNGGMELDMKDSLVSLKSMVLEWRDIEMERFIKENLKITYLMDMV